MRKQYIYLTFHFRPHFIFAHIYYNRIVYFKLSLYLGLPFSDIVTFLVCRDIVEEI